MAVDRKQENGRVFLVGTIHLDPRGEDKLYRLLDRLKPQVITLEVSRYALYFRQRYGERLRARLARFLLPGGRLPPALQPVAAQLDLPFEFRAAKAWARENQVRLEVIGSDTRSRGLLRLLEKELLEETNLEKLSRLPAEPLRRAVAAERRRAASLFKRPRLLGSEDLLRIEREEQALAQRIRKLLPCSGRLVHVGGWEHLAGLGLLLADLKPRLKLL